MVADINNVTVVGNLAADPEVKIFSSGATRCRFRVALNGRFVDKETGEWKDKDPVYMTVVAWSELAANVGASVRRGDRVVVIGRLRQFRYEPAEGDKRTVTELDALTVAADLSFAIARATKVKREMPASADGAPPSPEPTDDDIPAEEVEAEPGDLDELEPENLPELAHS